MFNPLDFFGTQTINLTAPATQGIYGTTPGKTTPVDGCFVVEEQRITRSATGEDQISTARVFLPMDTPITVDHLVDIGDGTPRRILAINRNNAPGLPLPETLEAILQ
ncbi:hypothetical protein [Varibaculum cambriense]|uniref:Head-tail adaptor protein n=1 Tax=Varibaculum cambriense TaxID=184870 RepID=A0ABX4UP20_9ACTO|nr:hypothetical protein [Varibaculum cambriense]PMB89275.1 hypothetical protein CJ240_05780 [Varibaculum cambriense]